eukprot:924742-Amphidinium_carterae.1
MRLAEDLDELVAGLTCQLLVNNCGSHSRLSASVSDDRIGISRVTYVFLISYLVPYASSCPIGMPRGILPQAGTLSDAAAAQL